MIRLIFFAPAFEPADVTARARPWFRNWNDWVFDEWQTARHGYSGRYVEFAAEKLYSMYRATVVFQTTYLEDGGKKVVGDGSNYFEFEDNEDATAFLLRWS